MKRSFDHEKDHFDCTDCFNRTLRFDSECTGPLLLVNRRRDELPTLHTTAGLQHLHTCDFELDHPAPSDSIQHQLRPATAGLRNPFPGDSLLPRLVLRVPSLPTGLPCGPATASRSGEHPENLTRIVQSGMVPVVSRFSHSLRNELTREPNLFSPSQLCE
jgi:hypothetical protein